MYLIFSFLRFAVTYRCWKCICFSPFRDLQSLFTTRSVSYFLLFLIYSHFRKLGVIFFSPFSDLRSLWKPGSVSFFLFLAICGHLPTPESDVQSLVSNKKTQQKTIFSPDAAGFLDSKKDSGISCLFWRRYFFLWGVAKTI